MRQIKVRSAYYIALSIIVIIIFSSTVIFVSSISNHRIDPEEIGDIDPNRFIDKSLQKDNSPNTIAVGMENGTIVYNQFFPSSIEIMRGESVTWHTLSQQPEFHTVTFMSKYNSSLSPFELVSLTDAEYLAAKSAKHFTVTINKTQYIAVLNAMVFNPSVVDSYGNTTYLNDVDVVYSMDGSEKYVNSGIFAPYDKGISYVPEIVYHSNNNLYTYDYIDKIYNENATRSFTIKFENEGEYEYICLFHKWMRGTVLVN